MLITCLKIMVFGSLTNVELINVGIEVTKDVELKRGRIYAYFVFHVRFS